MTVETKLLFKTTKMLFFLKFVFMGSKILFDD